MVTDRERRGFAVDDGDFGVAELVAVSSLRGVVVRRVTVRMVLPWRDVLMWMLCLSFRAAG